MNRSAISVKEFGQMLQSCCPPSGWGKLLAIAHSGGADSTCLLYLLHRLVSEHTTPGSPEGLLSVSIDHSLQLGSAATAEHCQEFSQSLQVPHVTLRIPWASPPFPRLPESGRPFESIARSARYRMLLEAMTKGNSTVMAMGHHADDHVETLLMRLARNDTGTSPMSMRNCRRWGMGSDPNGLDWAGQAGMDRWIVRPLLGVSKDRILATCEAHGLNYINDPTNFQPSLTPRNYVRHFLSRSPPQQPSKVPVELTNLQGAVRRLDAIAIAHPDLSGGAPLTERLRTTAGYIGQLRKDIDEEVNQYLLDFMRPSPPSTLLFCPPADTPERPLAIRRAIILRILRFVSPRPWGAPAAEASRQSSSLDQIGDRLWNSPSELRKRFTAGSEVIWTPVCLRKDGRTRLQTKDRTPGSVQAWLASRQPPIKGTASSPCERDISVLLGSQCTRGQILWDNRFVLHLQPQLLPSYVLDSCRTTGSVTIITHGRLLLPKIVWSREGHMDVLGGVGLDDGRESIAQKVDPDWVKFDWIRPLDAI